jgi:hypothetical protein
MFLDAPCLLQLKKGVRTLFAEKGPDPFYCQPPPSARTSATVLW